MLISNPYFFLEWSNKWPNIILSREHIFSIRVGWLTVRFFFYMSYVCSRSVHSDPPSFSSNNKFGHGHDFYGKDTTPNRQPKKEKTRTYIFRVSFRRHLNDILIYAFVKSKRELKKNTPCHQKVFNRNSKLK